MINEPFLCRNSPEANSPVPCPLAFTPLSHSGSPPSPSTLLSKVSSSCYGRFRSSNNAVAVSSPHTPRSTNERDKKGGMLTYSGLSKSFTALPRTGCNSLNSSTSSAETGYIGSTSKVLNYTVDNHGYLNPYGDIESAAAETQKSNYSSVNSPQRAVRNRSFMNCDSPLLPQDFASFSEETNSDDDNDEDDDQMREQEDGGDGSVENASGLYLRNVKDSSLTMGSLYQCGSSGSPPLSPSTRGGAPPSSIGFSPMMQSPFLSNRINNNNNSNNSPSYNHQMQQYYALRRARSNSIFQDECDNWNARFQEIVKEMRKFDLNSTIEEKAPSNMRFLDLVRDFIHAAKTYGRIIISERYLKSKTIKPLQLGGLAGGEKYVVHNIMFKFAVDVTGMLGSDYVAAKVAGNELKGLISYFNCGVPDLHVPLMALVDYLGFRLIAMSLLPITERSMVYGTRDGGYTILNNNTKVAERMRMSAASLNLKPHICGMKGASGVKLSSAADVEGHLGVDGRFYLLDFSRTLPPVKPDPKNTVGHLYLLFRPEFVKSYYKPLCPDAFSGFIEVDPNCETHNREIVEATSHLKEKVLPVVAMHLAELVLAAKQKGQVHSLPLTETLHSKGVNMRLLGLLLPHFPKDEKFALCTSLILAEAAVRVIKYFVRTKLRERMKNFQEPLRSTPYINTVIDYSNLVFGYSEASDRHWNEEIKREMREKFSVGEPYTSEEYNIKAILEESYNPDFDQMTKIRSLLFNRFQQLTGIEFTRIAVEKYEALSRGKTAYNIAAPFDCTDLEAIGEHIKHMGIMNDAQGSFYFYKGTACNNAKDVTSAVHFFSLAIEKYQLALRSTPNSNQLLLNIALCQVRVLELQKGSLIFAMDDPQVQEAMRYFLRALEADPKDPCTLYHYAKFLWQCDAIEKAEKNFLRCLTVEPNYIIALEDYAQFVMQIRKDVDIATRFVDRANKLKHLKNTQNNSSALSVML
eukprot:TRINITY_DN2166_c0_g4_i2.p1 TRINITY_DN2166_c0_g4~~TRINITY_DN2166_c0_g4_i2.p1  ORF type:complete len:974 (+),score=252.47 TRINITY_DN2166_c0_g4_i2:436-3357(+)